MEQRLNIARKFGQGITPQAFIAGMRTLEMSLSGIPNTTETFADNYARFAWAREEDRAFFASLRERGDFRCVVLCTDWCPDVIWNVPVLFRAMEYAGIPTEVLPMEEHPETMDLFLTDGGRAQPIAVFARPDGEVLGRWGARPAYLQAIMNRFKREHPDKEHPDYRTKLNGTYREIGERYRDGTAYLETMIEELRALIAPWIA